VSGHGSGSFHGACIRRVETGVGPLLSDPVCDSSPGAVSTASVQYSTGRTPVSFSGSAQTVGGSGRVGWSWHMESKGSGGTGAVTCSFRGQSKSVTASFSIG